MAGHNARGAESMKRMDHGPGASGDEAGASPTSSQLARLGGARADFVAALGRRVAELKTLAGQLEAEPTSTQLRDDLRRRVHALAAGARLLRFARLSEQLCEAEATLLIAADRGEVALHDVARLRTTFEQLPALAWGEADAREAPTPPSDRAAKTTPSGLRPKPGPLLDPVRVPLGGASPSLTAKPAEPQTVLVFGSANLADALLSEGGGAALEVERADEGATAIDVARALAPDVVVVDAEHEGARHLCEALLSDPLTETIPVVVAGAWARPEDAAPFVALGVARTLAKPVSPSVLQRACVEASAVYGRGEIRREPLGELSVDDLGARLAEELRRGLCDAALPQGRGTRFDLGQGSDVLAALWGAVARVRDLVTIASEGSVRFAPAGPEGALPIAPWISDAVHERRGASTRDAEEDGASLGPMVVVVADDDPAVTWFVSGVLRAEGAIVHEAPDGDRALQLAYRVTPDVVISDVIMPGLDGFALCRALKRDLALRDVPVILLSWKEDLLQRVRELGAGADAYLRKESAAPEILQRVREITRGRRRVQDRLAQGGEVRGRLDDLSPRTLLGLVCAVRPDATLTVRDTTFLYEIDLRGGRPVRATRTSVEGTFERGADVLAALLAVGAGRFVVTPASGEVSSTELAGTLDEQLLPHLAMARAAQRLLSGVDLVSVERVDLDDDRLGTYAHATPEPARTLLRTLAAGASPRAIITSGQASARLVEDVLLDAAARGVVAGVFAANGEDQLPVAVLRETEILRGARTQRAPVVLPELDLGPVIYTSTPAPVEIEAALAAPAPVVIEAPAAKREATPVPPKLVEASIVPEVRPPLEAEARGRREVRERPVVATLGSLSPPPVVSAPPPPAAPRSPSVPRPVSPPPPAVSVAPPATNDRLDETPSRTVRRPSSYAVRETPKPERPKTSEGAPNRSMWLLFAVAGVVFAVGARLSRERELARTAPPPEPAAEVKPAEAPAPAPAPTVAPSADLKSDGQSKADPVLPQEGPLRVDDKVPAGQGMLQIVAGTSDTIWIDGTQVGNGPIIKRALAPKKDPYEIRARLRGEDRVRFALVKEGRLTRIRIAPPWSR